MVDFDLRELSAPIEALRTELNEAYGDLDRKWHAVEKSLKRLPIPCTISYTFHENATDHCYGSNLEWRKWKGKKRICINHYSAANGPYGYEENEDVIPYEEWSGEQRLEMLEHLPNLFKAGAEQTKEFIAKVKSSEGKNESSK